MDSQFLGSDLSSGNTAEAASTDSNRVVRNIFFNVLGEIGMSSLFKNGRDHVTPSVKLTTNIQIHKIIFKLG